MFGRGNGPKTGGGLPEGLNSGSTASTSIDPKLQQKAKAIADAKLAQNIQNKPLGGSSDVRIESGTATNIIQAKTPAEIKAWQAAVKAGKASGKYNETVTMESSATGQDQVPTKPQDTPTKPVDTPTKPPAPKYYGTWYTEQEHDTFGGWGSWGKLGSREDAQARQNRPRRDTDMFKIADVTDIEDKVSSRYGDITSPFHSNWKDSAGRDSDHSPGSGEKRRQAWLSERNTKITGEEAAKQKLKDAAAARRQAIKDGIVAKKKAEAEALAAKKAAAKK